MAFLLRVMGWSVLNAALIVAGAFLGALMAPKVNPHNDWGVTSMQYSLMGALAGTSSVIALLLWRYERRLQGTLFAGDEARQQKTTPRGERGWEAEP
jgi:hypothetical protein